MGRAFSINQLLSYSTRQAVVVALALASRTASGQVGSVDLNSPNEDLRLTLSIAANGRDVAAAGELTYQISYRGKPLIEPSRLGLELEGQEPLGNRMRVTSVENHSEDATYRVPAGKSNPIRDHYNALRLKVREMDGMGRSLWIEARAYEDGVAFRYVAPKQLPLQEFRLAAERTMFNFPTDAVTYPLMVPSFHTSYEGEHHKVPLSGIPPNSLIALPLLVEEPGVGWLAITEAALDRNAGLFLAHPVENSITLEARLAPSLEVPGISVVGDLPYESPWRVFMIASHVGGLIESNIISNLNPPSVLRDTSWIIPGKAAWPWWSGEVLNSSGLQGGMNTSTLKFYTDFAASSGFQYLVIDSGWYGDFLSPDADITKIIPELDLSEIVRYAGAKGVRVWLWAHWRSVDRQMQEAFPLFEKWGIAGVKIDFMEREDQWMIEFYHRVLRAAAQTHLMIDFHGACKPSGWSRTFPNLLTMEGVMGLEYVKWSARANPDNDLMLPFTRMLTGPMDYTPGGFNSVTRDQFVPRSKNPMVMGTRAHQLAMYVVYESPFQMVSDHPLAYEKDAAFQFIRDVPVSWDDTKVLNASVGGYITIARKSNEEWYLGSMTNWDQREFEAPLDFLKTGKYIADIYQDGLDAAANPKAIEIRKQHVDASTKLKIRMAPGGGFAVRLHRASE